jgi:hypothetical protein
MSALYWGAGAKEVFAMSRGSALRCFAAIGLRYDRTDQGRSIPAEHMTSYDVELRLIQSGKATQNVCIERFNERFHDECLNEHGFSDVSHARKTISEWCQDYKWLEKQGLIFYAGRAEKMTNAEINLLLSQHGSIGNIPTEYSNTPKAQGLTFL